MNRAYQERQPIGKIESGIDQRTLLLKTINYVRQILPIWRDDPSRAIEESEIKLNSQLCKYLNTRAPNEFPMVRFNHEEPQFGSRSVDLSVTPAEVAIIGAKQYSIYEPFLVLECKRLPAPTQDRKKEYVIGEQNHKSSGAIQRFKLGLHGADLSVAAIIGYLQERSAGYWHRQINKWISELCNGSTAGGCAWNGNEILNSLDKNAKSGIANCWSVHGRNKPVSSQIILHHLWIKMKRS